MTVLDVSRVFLDFVSVELYMGWRDDEMPCIANSVKLLREMLEQSGCIDH